MIEQTDFGPLDQGTRPAPSIIRRLCWLPMTLFAVSLTLLGLIVMAPWAFAAWVIGGKQ
jgi:hypothetical protein